MRLERQQANIIRVTPIRVLFTPQASARTRITYCIDPNTQWIEATIERGRYLSAKHSGQYITTFQADESTSVSIDLTQAQSLQDIRTQTVGAPIDFVTDFNRDEDGVPCVVLLRQYNDVDRQPAPILYPAWHSITERVEEDAHITDLPTSLTGLQVLAGKASALLGELCVQCYNLSLLLDRQIAGLGSHGTPAGSPTMVRTAKTSILMSEIAYIEALVNYVGRLALELDEGVSGGPANLVRNLTLSERKSLLDESVHVRLESKWETYPSILSDLLGKSISIDKGNHHWGLFLAGKATRDSITHVKFNTSDSFINLSLDDVGPSASIRDTVLSDVARAIYWFNEFVTGLFRVTDLNLGPFSQSLNHSVPFHLFFLKITEIAGVSSNHIKKDYRDWGVASDVVSLLRNHTINRGGPAT